ncbi:MAG: DUF839 domain-containing protein [Bdellovibrionaceae bacterium]|nr:DUF839 domain-containing protein [Pseudobdellovibrionaceae bacterium]
MSNWQRREFIKFMGKSGLSLSLLPLLNACESLGFSKTPPITAIAPSAEDLLILSPGLKWENVISWGTRINEKNERFGFNCDYIAFIPINENESILWVNHESPNPIFVSNYIRGGKRTKEQVIEEQKSVGGSLIKIKNERNVWQVVSNDPINRRIDGRKKIPFANGERIAGQNYTIGTIANCAGGITPWGNILSCEENYHDYYGENQKTKRSFTKISAKNSMGWDQFFNYPPEHYGWCVEVNPQTGYTIKHTSLGRYAHECATVTEARDGRIVVYSGDDKNDECIYKLISYDQNSIKKGDLYVADIEKGHWISLQLKDQPQLKKYFKNQLEVLTHTRFAAHEVGASALDRPEDIEICPTTGHVYVSLTNNKPRGNFHGKILKIIEKDNDPASLEFKAETFLNGGELTGFSSPDNLVFDKRGNLWMTNDISGKEMNKPPYASFRNNGLFYIPLTGAHAGRSFQVASAPNDAELTGPCFSADFKTLFLSVQHPGETSKSIQNLTSHWPEGGDHIPRPTVVAISGPALDNLMK